LWIATEPNRACSPKATSGIPHQIAIQFKIVGLSMKLPIITRSLVITSPQVRVVEAAMFDCVRRADKTQSRH
jgi:hypothetical protein